MSNCVSILFSMKYGLFLLVLFSTPSCNYSMPNLTKEQAASCLIHGAAATVLTKIIVSDGTEFTTFGAAAMFTASALSHFHSAHSAISQDNIFCQNSRVGTCLISSIHIANIMLSSLCICDALVSDTHDTEQLIIASLSALSLLSTSRALYSAAKNLTSKSCSGCVAN